MLLTAFELPVAEVHMDSTHTISKMKTDSAEAWYCKGEIFFRQNKYEEAFEAFSRALDIKPGFEDAAKFRDTMLHKLDKKRISN